MARAATTPTGLEARKAHDEQAENEVDGPGNGTLGERDVLGAELVDAGGDAVVDAPADAGADDEQAADVEAGTWLEYEKDASAGNEGCGGHEPAAELLVEDGRRYEDGGDELEVQQQ